MAALDEYLQRFARQHANANVSRTYVATDGSAILGFCSLAMSAIGRENLPSKHQNRFPNFPLPVARLARLAVDQRHQQRGVGELILADALQRCLRLSEEIGMIGVVVDAKDEHARGWYERYEFECATQQDFEDWRNNAAGLLLLPADVNRSYQAKTFEEKAPHYAKQNLYAASLTAAAYEHQPQFDAFRLREGLNFRAYESFGKDQQLERRDLLLALAQRIWAPERIGEYALQVSVAETIGAADAS